MNIAVSRPKESEQAADFLLSGQALSDAAKYLLDRVLPQAEKDERDLAYYTPCKSEHARKQSGSYYTPVDVAQFFWNQYFDVGGISRPEQAIAFVRQNRLIEPSCGSGVLVYALLAKLLDLGVPVEVMRDLDLHMVDFNSSALDYAKSQFDLINAALGADYFTPSFEHTDFLNYAGVKSARPVIVFGNPPFVSNPKGAAWKNTYADFLDRCLEVASPLAAIHFILPLSIAFSRDYSILREKMRAGRYTVFASHFDNIPDTLFKSGKPQSSNTNKANSQRCTILSAFSSAEHCLYSSPLYRWSAADRATLLAGPARFHDVTRYQLSDQFIRPASEAMALYLQGQGFSHRLGDLLDNKGNQTLFVGSVARNYISVRGEAGSGVQEFSFRNREDFYRCLGIITSDVFLQYWRSVGDGFHVTRSNILDFPVSPSLSALLDAALPKIKSMWSRRRHFVKTKLNSGTVVHSYDFSAVSPNFGETLPQATKKEQTRNEEQ
ncbi:hypothetical protein [Sedimentitalea arenosa]|nr:hypothetical protein [Arenibacterium arenosum]